MKDLDSTENKKIIFKYPLKPEDSEDIYENKIKTSEKENDKSLEKILENFKKCTRTKIWYKETASRLQTALDVINLQNHDHPKVRYEMCELCQNIVLQCPK